MDPSLTDKDGKQDAEEDDDEKHELQVQETGSVRNGVALDLYTSGCILRLRDTCESVKGDSVDGRERQQRLSP